MCTKVRLRQIIENFIDLEIAKHYGEVTLITGDHRVIASHSVYRRVL